MSAQSNQPPVRGSVMPSPALEAPRTPSRSQSATPGVPQGADCQSSAPNQPPNPPYKSPYVPPAPLPAPNGNTTMVPSQTYPRDTPQTYSQPRPQPPAAPVVPAPTIPTLSQQALRGSEGTRTSAGYIAYSNELRKATAKSKVRGERLSPVSYVERALKIVADTVCVPSADARFAGVMAGNPMINSVKVIKSLAEFNEELEDKIDDRDAYIRQMHALQTEIKASHEQAIKAAVEVAVGDALREAVRPLPKPTEEQVADLKKRDDIISALKEFIQDQTKRIIRLEDARDAAIRDAAARDAEAQQQIEEAKRSNSQDLSLHDPQHYDGNLGHGHDQGYEQDERVEHDQGRGHDQGYEQNEGFENDQGHGHDQGYDLDQVQNFTQGELQNYDSNQGFNETGQTFGQAPAFNFGQYPDLDHDFSPNSKYHQAPPQYDPANQQSFGGQRGMVGQQGMLLQQGLESQPSFMGQHMMPNLQGMEDPFFTPHQQDVRPRFAQQNPPRAQDMQGQQNSSTPNRRKRTPSQQSTPASQTMQGKRQSLTPRRRQKKQKVVEEKEKITLEDLRGNLRKEQMENKQGGRYQDGFKRSF
ncbi:hypothetical protein IFR05_010585 [Cadophora sp. M221]|nr:hypothetical protein IFR05_010585 [Cadophora sp. M221]